MDVLGRHKPNAKTFSGGMTLILLLKIRLAEPSILVDVNGISDLEYLREEGGQLHMWGVDA
jgi:carbon-monoxide dehydrogenase medium subunit